MEEEQTTTTEDIEMALPRTSLNSTPNSASQQGRHRTVTALVDMDGRIVTVKAHKIKTCIQNRSSVSFIIQTIVLCGIIAASIAVLIAFPSESAQFIIFQNLLTFSIGVLIPSPKLKKEQVV